MSPLLLWIARTLEEDGEVRCCDTFDGRAQLLHRRRRTHDRRRLLEPRTRAGPEAGASELQTRPFDFEDERADVRRKAERLKVPFAEPACRIEAGFEQAVAIGIGSRYFERDRFRLPRRIGPSHPGGG